MDGIVVAVSRSATYTFVKANQSSIQLLTGLGVEGDAHMGETVNTILVPRQIHQPNLRQVHLVHAELHDELRAAGFDVLAGQMGKNTRARPDLLGLPCGTRLHLGSQAVVEITGIHNPCGQLDHFRSGLISAVLDHDDQGNLIRKSGVMGIVLMGRASKLVTRFSLNCHR